MYIYKVYIYIYISDLFIQKLYFGFLQRLNKITKSVKNINLETN